MMKAGAIFAATLLFGAVSAQDKEPLYTTSYATGNGVTVVAFITEDRDDFYELIERIGKTDRWEYSVGWKPHFRLSIYVSPDETSDALKAVLKSLHMKMDGEHASLFTGERSGRTVPKATAAENMFSLSVKNVPSLSVIAIVAEGLNKELRVLKAKSMNVPSLGLETVSEESFLRLFSRLVRLDVKVEERHWLVTGKNKN